MNIFKSVKQSVTTRQAAEQYGIKVNRRGMAVCPFHNDKNPSLKVDNRFYCFGCGATGDVIDFTSQLYGLSNVEAAKKLAIDFGISYDTGGHDPPGRKPNRKEKSAKQRYLEEESRCFRVFSDYRHLLKRWQQEYAPQSEQEHWHPLFSEPLERLSYIEYLLDCLLSSEISERAAVVIEHGKEVAELEQRISELTACDETGIIRHTECNGEGNDSGGNPGYVGDDTKRWSEKQSA